MDLEISTLPMSQVIVRSEMEYKTFLNHNPSFKYLLLLQTLEHRENNFFNILILHWTIAGSRYS